jgi:sarcosine reductase
MGLIRERYAVSSIAFGKRAGVDPDGIASLENHCLTVDTDALAVHLCAEDSRLADVRVGKASPGERTRIVCVKDVVQPRFKVAGAAPGEGVLRILDGCAVVTCGPIVGFQEGIVDMSGPGAAYTPFSALSLIVLEVAVVDGTEPHEHEAALRQAGLRAADLIAAACAEADPDASEEIALAPLPDEHGLPRIAYVYMVLAQGLLHDTFVLGRDAKTGLPMTVAPEIACDNAVVSGNCVSACDKNTTWHHQNNPIVTELIRGHGTRWDFAGIVLTPAPTRLHQKEDAAKATVEMVGALRADGAIISKEGFGNPDADLMMLIRGLEKAGVRTAGITDEFAGADGGSQSLADTTPEADAMVSVGNANQRILLPAMDRTYGPLPDTARLAGGYPHTLGEDGTLDVELQAIIGATNQFGAGRLRCREA